MPQLSCGILFIIKYFIMDESILKSAIAAISSGEYGEDDVVVAKHWLDELNKKELSVKRKMEQAKNEFSKKKSKNEFELKAIRHDIKQMKSVMKNIKK
jgi:hypothetical protein